MRRCHIAARMTITTGPEQIYARRSSMRLQKLGGYASIGLAVQFLVSLGFFVFVLPKLGLASPNDFGDPVKGLAALAASPATFLMLNVVNASFSMTALLLALALRE